MRPLAPRPRHSARDRPACVSIYRRHGTGAAREMRGGAGNGGEKGEPGCLACKTVRDGVPPILGHAGCRCFCGGGGLGRCPTGSFPCT